MSYARTLILTQGFMPHQIVDWKAAVTKMLNGKIEVQAQYDEVLARIDRNTLLTFPKLQRALRNVIGTDADSITIHVPAVAVLRRKVRHKKTGVKFSQINLCMRDKFTCQYCSERLPMSLLNKDHVLPRGQGGKTTWENIVMSCFPCNSRKANRTPEQAGMMLLTVPVRPKVLPMHGPYIDKAACPVEWLPFLGQSAA